MLIKRINLLSFDLNEMQSILEFMYLGVATFYQEWMNEFINVANSLEIKEISNTLQNSLKTHIQSQQEGEKYK